MIHKNGLACAILWILLPTSLLYTGEPEKKGAVLQEFQSHIEPQQNQLDNYFSTNNTDDNVHTVQEAGQVAFGELCYTRLRPQLWQNVLNFLLGDRHILKYTLQPSVFPLCETDKEVSLGDNGRLTIGHTTFIYRWYPHGKWPPEEACVTWPIPDDLLFDRVEHQKAGPGTITLISKDHKRIQTRGDTDFTQQAEFDIEGKSFFQVASGKTIICAPHPLITKDMIRKITVMRFNDKTFQYKTSTIDMPPEGVMPPIEVIEVDDDEGGVLAAHATRTHEVYLFNIATQKQIGKITLSKRRLEAQKTAIWHLVHPITQRRQLFRAKLRNEQMRIKIVDDIDTPANSPHSNLCFQQAEIGATCGLAFAKKKTKDTDGTPYLVSLTQEILPSKNILTTSRWNTNGKRGGLANIESMAEGPLGNQAVSYSGAIFLLSSKGYNVGNIHFEASKNPWSRTATYGCMELQSLIKRSPAFALRPHILTSPSGFWALYKEHTISTEDEAAIGFQLQPPVMFYFGAEKMNNLPPRHCSQESFRPWQEFVMRLYAMQCASARGEHVEFNEKIIESTSVTKSSVDETDDMQSSFISQFVSTLPRIPRMPSVQSLFTFTKTKGTDGRSY